MKEGDEGRGREDGSVEVKKARGEGRLGWVGKERERKKRGGVREIVKWRE